MNEKSLSYWAYECIKDNQVTQSRQSKQFKINASEGLGFYIYQGTYFMNVIILYNF